MRTQKAAARRQLKGRRLEMRRALKLKKAQDPLRRKMVRKRNRRIFFLLLILLILLLLRDCRCDGAPAQPTVAATPKAEVKKKQEKKKKARVAVSGRIKTRKRTKYRNEIPTPKPWLPGFRMQVAARSPKLSRCFEGMAHPGALKWIAAVDPRRGLVSDHVLEPLLFSEELGKAQRECVLQTLTDPPYRLSTDDDSSAPQRVAIVIEF